MTETLIAAAEPDRFTSESPIRAFTEFRVAGTWAIGKGFRPSLAHLHTYLDAMQNKEGWHLVQMLDGGSLNPTLIFQRDRIMSFTVPKRDPLTMEDVDAWLRDQGFALISTPEGHLRYEPERKIGKHPALGAPYTPSEDKTPEWMRHGSDVEIPHEHREACAKMVIERVLNAANSEHAIERTLKDFKKRFLNPRGTPLPPHDTLASQLLFLLPKANPVRVKQMIDGFREEHRLGFREPYKDFAAKVLDTPEGKAAVANAALSVYVDDDPRSKTVEAFRARTANVGDDPINPAYYDGTHCAEIIEHMPTNVGLAGKYIWRLGEKDEEKQECGKAAWYLHRQLNLDHGWTKAYRSASFFQWYRQMADGYINAAQKAGKLSTWRATAMSALVSYTITGEESFLHTVIGFLEGSECFKEYGSGLAI